MPEITACEAPVVEIPAQVPAGEVEDYGATVSLEDLPCWEEPVILAPEVPAVSEILEVLPWDEPVEEIQPQVPAWEEEYEKTVAVWPEDPVTELPAMPEIPVWDEPVEENQTQVPAWEEEYEKTAAVWPEDPVTEIPAMPEIPVWDEPVEENQTQVPNWEEEYEKTVAVWPEDPVTELPAMPEIPVWDEPVEEIQPQVPNWEEEYEKTVAVWPEDPVTELPVMPEIPVWEEPTVEIQPQAPAGEVEDYGATVSLEDLPSWDEPVILAPEVPAVSEILEVPSWEESVEEIKLQEDIVELQPLAASAEPGDYERTMAVFPIPEVAELDGDSGKTEFSRRENLAEVPDCEAGQTLAVMREEPRSEDTTGKYSLFPPDWEEPVKPVATTEPERPVRQEQIIREPHRAVSVPVKPRQATAAPVDIKVPEVPDYGRSMSAEVCDFTLRQQWNWLQRLNEVIPTLRLGTEPSCVDFPLTLANMKAAGDMRITVKQIAVRVGIILAITNLENAITCEDDSKLRAAAQILTAYGKMVTGRQAEAIRMTVRYLGVRVAELKMQ